jgi:hypothetical protein
MKVWKKRAAVLAAVCLVLACGCSRTAEEGDMQPPEGEMMDRETVTEEPVEREAAPVEPESEADPVPTGSTDSDEAD